MSIEVIAWSLGFALLIAGELAAVFNRRQGDTVSEVSALHAVTWAGRLGLPTWLLWHWWLDDILVWGPAWDLVALALGWAIGAGSWGAREQARDDRPIVGG